MKYGWLVAMILLAACQGGSGGGGGSGSSAPNPPTPHGELQWGDLACQKRQRCQDQVLNKSWSDLQYFFELNFQKPQGRNENETHESLVYRCGLKTQKTWMDFFRVPSGSNEAAELSESGFFDGILDLDSCTRSDDFREKMKTYFKNTGDYKNETK